MKFPKTRPEPQFEPTRWSRFLESETGMLLTCFLVLALIHVVLRWIFGLLFGW